MRLRCVQSMYTSVQTEEKLFLWILAATVAFFLLAATSITPGSQDGQPGFPSTNPKGGCINTTAAWKQYEMVKEQVVRGVFLKLKDEHVQFWEKSVAKAFLPGRQDSRRKARCGDWNSELPSLFLRYMGKRCPPGELA